MNRRLRIGTRGSKLALAQAQVVADQLAAYGAPASEIVVIKTRGDQRASFEPSEGALIGNVKKSFVEEIENELFSRKIDLAVHSLKDLPTTLPAGLRLCAVLNRDEARDALVSRRGYGLTNLPTGSRIGTSSMRRKAQLLALRSDVVVEDLHGNVDTRIKKMDSGDVDAIVLSAAGLFRIGKRDRIAQILDVDMMLPAPGQGAIAVEIPQGDNEVDGLVSRLDHDDTHAAVMAERSFAAAVGGDCNLPIAAYADVFRSGLRLTGLIGSIDGTRIVKRSIEGLHTQPEALGRKLADTVLAEGGAQIVKELV